MNMRAKLYFDGASSPHKGRPASYGYVLEASILAEGTAQVPEDLMQTNNVAEYMGLIEGLKKAISLGISDIEIVGDSQLIIYQLEGRFKCRAKHLKPLHAEARRLLDLMPSYTLRWVPRKENRADEKSRVL